MKTETDRDNNFGLVRLLLAVLVIVSHSAEIIDGNRSREIATSIWHTLSSGEMAVDGFFLISGYLVTQSFEQSSSLWSYVRKRVLRIYPAFIIAFLFCLLAVAPFAGAAQLDAKSLALSVGHMLLLDSPNAPGAFAGLHYPALNGAMWSIPYEFRCYIMVAVLGSFGLLKWRAAITAAGMLLLIAIGFGLHPHLRLVGIIAGDLTQTVRLTGCFLIGMSFYLYRDKLRYEWPIALGTVVVLVAALFVQPIAELAWATLGGYGLFWFIFRAPTTLTRWLPGDVSYGVYLYAWPVQSLLVYYAVTSEPWLISAITIVVTVGLGATSWWLIERPAMRFRRATAVAT